MLLEKNFDTLILPVDFTDDDLEWMSALWANVERPLDDEEQVTVNGACWRSCDIKVGTVVVVVNKIALFLP